MSKFLHKIFSYLRHPFGVTCLDCGFLALEQSEMVSYRRVLLSCRGLGSNCPPLEYVKCFESFWPKNHTTKKVFDMVEKQRRDCRGYFKYIPGLSPLNHRELLKTKGNRLIHNTEVSNGVS